MERLKNELTKLTTMRVLRALVTCKVSESSDEHLLAFTPAVIDIVVAECVACMKKSHRQLKVAALGLLENLIREQPRLAMSSSSSSKKRSSASSTVASAGGSVMSESVMDIVLPELKVLFIDSDLHILPLAFTTLVVCIEFHPSKVIPQIRSDALVQSLVSTILHSPHLVASGSALDALLDFWKCYVLQGGEMGLGDVLVREVFDLVVGSALSYSADATAASIAAAKTAFAANSPSSTEVLSKLSLSIVSKSLSTVLIACGTASWSSNVQKDVFATLVADMEKPLTAAQLQQPPLTCREEVSKYISIMTIGEMGAHV